MRVEPFTVDSYIHVVKRGARGLPITGDVADKNRFLNLLYYMNDAYLDENWHLAARREQFSRSSTWPKRSPLVSILAYTLMSNHIHLLLKETQEGGVSTFMQKLGQSMTNHFNDKYEQRGSIFQGSYRSRTIEGDKYMHYVAVYIMVKNVFELYPKGGLKGATANFEAAWEWGISYRYSSLVSYASDRKNPIIDKDILASIFLTPRAFKAAAKDVIAGGKWALEDFE